MIKKLTNNLGVKLLSLLIAIIFWITIINTQDPIEQRTYYGIPVTLINQEAVTQKEKIPEVISGDFVDVVVEGKRTELDNLTKSDFVATADLTEISFMDAVLVRVKLPNHPNVTVLNNGENVLKLIFDDYVTRKFSFRINTTGQAEQSYFVGDAIASPNMIELSGAKTVLDKVSEVVLDVDVNGRNADFTTTAIPQVYGANGERIDAGKYAVNLETVSVMVPVFPTKQVHLRVDTVGELPEGYELLPERIAFQPETVTIAGTKEDLRKLSSYLTLKVDVEGQTGTVEKNIYIADVLDDSLTSLRVVNNQMVAVTVEITPYVDKTIELPLDKIEMNNLSEHLSAELLHTSPLLVKVKCKASRAQHLTADAIKAYVNLQGFTADTYRLELQMELPANVLYTEKTYIELVVRQKVMNGPKNTPPTGFFEN